MVGSSITSAGIWATGFKGLKTLFGVIPKRENRRGDGQPPRSQWRAFPTWWRRRAFEWARSKRPLIAFWRATRTTYMTPVRCCMTTVRLRRSDGVRSAGARGAPVLGSLVDWSFRRESQWLTRACILPVDVALTQRECVASPRFELALTYARITWATPLRSPVVYSRYLSS